VHALDAYLHRISLRHDRQFATPALIRFLSDHFVSGVQMKSWAGKALEIVNCCGFLNRRLIGAC
jgi:hypothetical protein